MTEQLNWTDILMTLPFLCTCMLACLVGQLCPTLWDRMDYSLPGSSVLGILQARILEWVAISFSRVSSQPEPVFQTLQVDSLLSELPGKLLYLCTHNASICINTQGFPGSSAGKESTCHAEDPDSIPGSGRFPWERIDYLLLYSCSKDPMGRGAWQATVCGVARSWTWLRD